MIVKLLAAASIVLSAVPAQQAPTEPTADLIARAKFPTEKPEFVDALAAINTFVNNAIEPVSDQDHYGVEDYWVQAPSDGKGDCEDYALTKLFVLQQAGFPIVTNTKIVAVIVHRGGGAEGHAILAVLMPGGDVAYLDNLNSEPMTRRELEAKGYQFFDWAA